MRRRGGSYERYLDRAQIARASRKAATGEGQTKEKK